MAEEQEAEITHLRESLARIEGMIDQGWVPLMGGKWDEDDGPSLDQVQSLAKRNREMLLNPHIGAGNELINSYVWSDGVHYEGIRGKKQGRGTNVQERIDNPVNQANFFSQLARKQRQTAYYCDGIVLYYGDDDNNTIHPVSITNITDDYRNPENPGEIWAYRRSWVKKDPTGKNPESKAEWIFVSRFHDKIGKRANINYNGTLEPIARNKRMFVSISNPVVGWGYGIPDVTRGIQWAENYRQAMKNGEDMNAAMAGILGSVKSNTVAGAQQAAVTVGGMTGGGGLAHVGQQNAIQTLSTAGQGYDFSRSLPILACFAAGIGVSVIALSMNSGNAGGSYGAARSLDRPEQLSTKTRRSYNKALDQEILLWLGADVAKLDIWFDTIMDPTEQYRAEQIIELRLGTGLYEGDEVKKLHAILDGRDPNKVTPVPEGWLIPNNKESIELRTIDPNTSGATANPANGGDMAPTQGSGAKSTPTGGSNQKSDDIRSNREYMEMQDKLDAAMRMIAEVLENQKGE
jgi:hypothetical protein